MLLYMQEHVVVGLKPKTRYSVSVAAFTIKGAGPLSEIKYTSTKGEGKGCLLCNINVISASRKYEPFKFKF